jgi:formyltetrahydrofolate hydrolase
MARGKDWSDAALHPDAFLSRSHVARVDHALSAEQCAAVGRDVECAVLARAVQWQVEHRILLNGRRTVVFK